MRNIDQLSNMTTEYDEVDIETYFEPMNITKEQKKERKDAAEDLWWVLLLLFGLIKESIDSGDLDYAFIYDTFKESYTEAVLKYADQDDYINQYVNMFTQNTLDTTWNHIDLENKDSYWLSNRRALRIAVNEANTILNYEDLQRAIKNGMNVKIWRTQKDSKVREDHKKLEGKKIGITEMFEVGDSFLQFPCDEVNCTNVRDIAGCRCYAKADYDPKFDKIQTDYYVGKNGKALPSEYSSWIGDSKRDYYLSLGTNSKYLNAIEMAYRKNSFIGDGGCADVLRFERETGLKCGHNQNDHSIKCEELLRYFANKVSKENLSQAERSATLEIEQDIRNALSGK